MGPSGFGSAPLVLSLLLASCTATSGSNPEAGSAVVEFSFDSVRPQTVRIAAGGNVSWINIAADSRGFVVFPVSIASGFTCGENLSPYFRRTLSGFQSLPITDFGSETVKLPCPLKPGSYPYEIWVSGAGLGETAPGGSERKLSATIIVE
jgi:hypothetical protein